MSDPEVESAILKEKMRFVEALERAWDAQAKEAHWALNVFAGILGAIAVAAMIIAGIASCF